MASLQTLLILLCVTVTVGTKVNLQRRIYGGTECLKTERLYHVKLIITEGTEKYLCGGSVIHERWILTAAHCLDFNAKWTIKANLRVHPTDNKIEKQVITKIFPYTDKNKKIHDIMLLQLPSKTRVEPINLPDCQDEPKINNEFQVAGHGRFKVDNNDIPDVEEPKVLLCAKMKVADCKDVKHLLPYPQMPYDNWLCGDGKRVDTCKGDSGGAVVYKGKIYGVIQGGLKQVCSLPSWFVKVCSYLKWIKDTINKNP